MLPEHLASALSDRYRLERELGAGGMATVYLAQDLKHDRRVAIKVLRPELAAVIGAERFLSEIRTTANLQHPHILPLFDSGVARGSAEATGRPGAEYLYYVMPFIEGESLRDRLTREKQLPIADAVRIATEVAGALDSAHRRGVIHRDIKPENILLHDGRALVADFGIALAASKAGGARMTETGMSLGTPTYMSPEQAMGEREITARSDVYALGAMTYEMLVGDPPFTGSTAQAIVAKVLTTQPTGLSAQRHTIPPQIEAAVLTALEKLPADRFATAVDFAAALTGAGTSPGHPVATAMRGRAGVAPWRGGVVYAALALMTGLAAWGWLRHPAAAQPVRRYAIALSGDEAITLESPSGLAISPDGERVAHVGQSSAGVYQIWIRDRDQLYARPLDGTTDPSSLAFSPDGRQIAFIANNPRALKIASVDGGNVVMVADSQIANGGLAWGRDGFLYAAGEFNGAYGIIRFPVSGGALSPVTRIDSASRAQAHIFPALLPNGRGVVFSNWYGPTRLAEADIAVADFKTGRPRVLLRGLVARYDPAGRLLVVRADGSLVAVPFDKDRMVTTGPPEPLLTGVATSTYMADFDISATGTLVYFAGAPRDVRENVRPVWVGRDGHVTDVDGPWNFDRPFNGGLSLSPDGRRLALAIAGDRTADIWIKQLDHGPLTRLTFEEFLKYRPTWSPDGRAVTYLVDPGNSDASIFRRRADGSGTTEKLLGSSHSLAEALWSRDGQWLVARTTIPSRDIIGFRPGTDSGPVPLIASPRFDERAATLSPDGRFIAYQSDESGREEVYVRPFPRTDDGRWQLSTMGGEEPLWGRTGREIFYRSQEAQMMMTVPVTTTPAFIPGTPRPLFSTRGLARTPGNRAYDVTPDDQRFIMLRTLSDSAPGPPVQLVILDNWQAVLAAASRRP